MGPTDEPRTGTRDALTLVVPAGTAYLDVLRHATTTHARLAGMTTNAAADLRLAVDELASILVAHGCLGAMLWVQLAHDDEDVYARLSTPCGGSSGCLAVPELSAQLLEFAGGSYEVREDDGRMFADVQRPLVAVEP